MIGYVKGEVAAVYEDSIILEAGGIGYNINMPKSCLDLIEGMGSQVKIHTYLHVREDALTLYGFLTKDDLDLYRMLISVNGVGPKAGLALLSVMTSDELRFAIISGDAKLIGKAPGVGPKTAQRIIIDLKDKIDVLPSFESGRASLDVSDENEGLTDVRSEAALALIALGYSKTDSYKAVRSASGNDVESVLKSALLTISSI